MIYAADSTSPLPAAPAMPRAGRGWLARLGPYLAILAIGIVILTTISLMNPQDVRKLVVFIDMHTFNMTAESQSEAMRVARIKQLTIPATEKDVLIRGQVYKGASPTLARLALGEPSEQIDLRIKDYGTVTLLIYLFEGSPRYTALQFVSEKLTGSEQLAAPDVEHLRNDPRRVVAAKQTVLPIAVQAAAP